MDPLPGYIIQRNDLFQELKQRYDEELKNKEKSIINIVINLAGGKELKTPEAKAWETSPGTLLRHLEKSAAAEVVVAKVDGQLWDLSRPLEQDCRVEYIPFSSPEGRNVFWHSSAHVLGEACECQYHCHLSHGPPVAEGFFYDMRIGEGEAVKETDWAPIQDKANKAMKEKQAFERLWVSKLDLEKMFGYSKYKMHYINNLLPEDGSTVYRCGTLVDLCLGPHIQNTNKIKAFQIMKNSSCYFLGDKDGDSLQRIYGVAFPDKKLLTEHLHFLEEAAKRDHRRIGLDQELFMFDDLAPGCPFFLPHGVRIIDAVQDMLRSQYKRRGYQVVQSPNMYDVDLWKTSGHWGYYQANMFAVQVDKRWWALKAMNCPGHCLIFRHRERSYRELPWRLADFGVLHRNEASGALHGLTRVRKFQQDDAHIFCEVSQLGSEMEGFFSFLDYIYGLFGFQYSVMFSTRPEKYLGDLDTWNGAESKLKEALDKWSARTGRKWELNEGDGAFYGPKIDIELRDALNRNHQCATLQLDFQLPQQFRLEYMTNESASAANRVVPKMKKALEGSVADESIEKNKKETEVAKPDGPGPGHARPVMLHRAIVGSFERFMGILIEHYAGKWPFWLSPRQVLVVPVMPAANSYVEELQQILSNEDFYCDIDISGQTMPKKILKGQQAQYNFIFVVGAEEEKSRSVNIRNRDDLKSQSKGALVPLEKAIKQLGRLRKERRDEEFSRAGLPVRRRNRGVGVQQKDRVDSSYHHLRLRTAPAPSAMEQPYPGTGALSATDYAQGVPTASSPLSSVDQQTSRGRFNEEFDASHQGSSMPDGNSSRQRSDSGMSQSQTLTPSRGGTLKKKNSLKRSGSLRRSGSRRSIAAGSVKSLALGDHEKYEGGNMYSAFFTPVPTKGNPTEILSNRFQDWRRVLKDLITYFREVQKSHEARSKSLLSLSNLVSNLSTPPAFLSEGGIGEATKVLQQYHKQALAESNKARHIEEEIVIQLTGLRSDLSQKIKEIKNLSGDFKNSVDKETESTRKAVRGLQEALGLVDTDPSATSGKGDPYIIKLGVERQIERQIDEENYLHKAFLNLENSGRELESIVVGEIQKSYNAYAGILKREADEAYETIENLRSGPVAMTKDREWDAFVSNNEHFVDPRMPVRNPEQITYPGRDAPAAAEVRAGMLERKSKYLKSYTPGWYVLSPTHLHEFKSPDHMSSQTPVMSLYLKEQKLGSHSNPDSSSHKFMLKGRQTGGMHRGHGWVFRAESRDTMLAWYEGIKNMTEKTGMERDAFVRRHTRSVSNGSTRAPSVSSDGGMEEDEADRVPYSASTQVDPASPREPTTPQRPQPGGKFPSDLNVDRHLHMPLSPSSGTSSDDRDAIAAAGALPGSGVPFGQSGHQVEEGEYGRAEEPPALVPVSRPSGNARNDYSASQPPHHVYAASPENVPVHTSTAVPHMDQAINNASYSTREAQVLQPVGPGPAASPVQFEHRYHDSSVPQTDGVGSASGPVSPISATFVHETNTVPVELSSAPSPPVESEKSPPLTFSIPPPASNPAPASGGLATPDSAMTNLTTSTIATKFGASRPPLASQQSGQTISELHVPGEYPRPSKPQ